MSEPSTPDDPAAGPGGGAGPGGDAAPHALSPARERMLRRLVPALLVVGAVVLVVFEATITLLLGTIFLLAAIVVGVVMIAEPGFLAGDDE